MADSPLIDIFDLCVERLAAGETVEDCLRDYPDYADELRGLLEMGSLVFQAQAHTNDEEQAQAHTRMRIEEALQTDFAPRKGQPNMHDADSTPEKEKNTPRPLRRTVFWMGSAAAAVFAFAFGFAFATTPVPTAQTQRVADASLYMTNVYLRDLLATEAAREVVVQPGQDEFILTATSYVREITQTAIAEILAQGTPIPTSVPKNLDSAALTATAFADADSDGDKLSNSRESTEFGTDWQNADTDGDGVGDGSEVMIWNSNPLKQDTDGDGITDGEEINVRGTNPLVKDTPVEVENEFILTATQYVREITQTAQAPSGPTEVMLDSFILTATQYVAEITQTAEVKFTQTAVMMGIGTTATPAPALLLPTEVALVLNTPLPAPTMAPADVSGAAHGDTAITGAVVSTSVAGYVAMTPTMAALEPIVAGEKDTTTSSVAPIPLEPAVVNEVPMGADGYTSDGRTVSGSGALAVTSGGGGPSTDLLALSTPLSYGDESTGLAALPNVQQQALQPLKAGEIDDNAEWDTYTEFRRNYLSTYGSTSIIDFDVTGRRIIKVVDAEGKPILGARVEVSMDKVIVSTSRTYATGLTLFFPNADPRTQRRDEFKVAVTVGQYQAFKTLDLRKLGDVIEIQMPIVIVRDANQQNGLPTVPPPPEVPTVFIGIPENLPTVPPPMMEATMPIVTYTPTPMLPTFTPTPFVR